MQFTFYKPGQIVLQSKDSSGCLKRTEFAQVKNNGPNIKPSQIHAPIYQPTFNTELKNNFNRSRKKFPWPT